MIFKKFFALAKENGINECEVNTSKTTSFSFSLFKGELTSYNIDSSVAVSARGIFNGKMGCGATEKDDSSANLFLINAIKETASLNESDDPAIIFEGAKTYKRRNMYSKKLASWSVDDKLKLYTDGERILANSYGLNLKDKSNYFFITASIVIKDGDEIKSNYKIFFDSDPDKFNIDTFVNELVKEGIEKLHGESIKAGKYKAVFSRECVASLVGALLSNVSSEQVQKHSSKFEGKLNEKVLSEKLTIYEKPYLRNFFYSYFDDEGFPTQDKVIFDKGVLKTFFYNLVTAKKDGVESTGNASRSGNKVGISFSNIVVKPGRSPLEQLFKNIKNGVYVTDITGLHAGLDSTSGDFSLQAEGFHVKDGKKDTPLTLFTVSGNLFELFNNIIAIGNDSKLMLSSITTPSIAFKNLKISAD